MNRQAVCVRPGAADWQGRIAVRERGLPLPGIDEMLCRIMYVTVDAHSLRCSDGALVPGRGVVEVVLSNAAGVIPGDVLLADCGWQVYSLESSATVSVAAPGRTLTELLSVRGAPGQRAWALLARTPVADGDIVVAPPSGTGLVALQLARARGARPLCLLPEPGEGASLVAAMGLEPIGQQELQRALGGDAAVLDPDRVKLWLTESAWPLSADWSARLGAIGAVVDADTVTLDVSEARAADEALAQALDAEELQVIEDIVVDLAAGPAALDRLQAGRMIGQGVLRVGS